MGGSARRPAARGGLAVYTRLPATAGRAGNSCAYPREPRPSWPCLDEVSQKWTEACSLNCDLASPLYCVETIL